MSAGAPSKTLFNKEPTVTDNKTKMQSGLCGNDCVAESGGAVNSQNIVNSRNRCAEEGDGVISGCWCRPAGRRPGLLCTAATTSVGPADGAETSQR